MNPFSREFFQKLRRRFLLEPAGYGRPQPKSAVDQEYRSGAWAHFHQLPELPRQSVIVGFVSQLHSNQPAILDLGCGSGRLAQLFQPYPSRRYVGVDLSTEGVRMAQELNLRGCEFVAANFEDWSPPEKFDVIIFSECIGYASDPGALVARYLPYLTAGGTVVISHFRYGHWQAHWRRVHQHATEFAATTVANAQGQTWDVRLLRPAVSP